MAGNMDERVVSMEFDNKQFEKNVKTSMKTIDDLKESLDFDDTGKSFDEFTTKCKKFGKDNCFKDVDDSVSKLRKGIGLLGDSAGGLISQFAEVTKITAMFEMAEAAVNKLKAAVKSFTIEPISQGFDKYTTKINSIKTIANATGMAADQVDASLDRLNWFTDETSASFDSMVQNIGKFTSVGKGLDESITAMQGIAAWGYHSGASIQEQNRAMYNLSQALGTGSVKLIDWKSIENAGMATKEFKEQAIAAAEAAGTLTRKGDKLFAGKEEVTVENFNSTLQKGWFSSDVLMSTLKEYGSFADKVRKYQEEHPQYALASEAMEAMDAERLAKQDAIYEKYLDTWSKNAGKSSAKIKEDVARINKIANVKEREKEIKAFAKTIGMSYEETKKALDDLADCEESLGEKAFKSSQQAKSFSEAIDATKDAVSTGWMKTFQYIFGGLDKSIELWSDVTEILWDLFAAGASFRNNAFMHWAEEFNGWADLWNADEEKGPLGALRNIANTIIELKELLGSSFKNVFFPELAKITGEIFGEEDAKTMAKNGLKTTDQLKQWREGNYMGYQIKNVTKGIREFTAKIREFFTNAENLEKIRTIFTSIATAVKFAVDTVGSFFRSVGDFIKKSGIIQDMLGLVSRIAAKITEIFGKIQKSGFIKNLFGKISDTFVWLYTTVKRWVNEIKEFFEETGIGQAIRDFFKRIEEFFIGGENDVDETGKKTESGFFRAFGWLQSVKDWINNINLKQILYDIKDFITNFGEVWAAFTAALGGGKMDKKALKDSGMSENMQKMVTKAWDFGSKLSGVFNFIKGIVDKVVGWLETSGILPAIRNAWDGIKTFFSNIGLIWDIFVKGKKVDPKDLDDKQKGLVEGITNFLKKIQRVWGKIKGWFSTAWAWISEKWNLFVGWLESSGILPKIRSAWEKIKTFFGNFGEVWAAFKTSLSGQKLDKKALKNSGMDEGLQGIIATVWGWGNGIHNAIEKVKEVWGKITDWLETSGILPTLRQWWADITGWFEEVSKDIQENGIFGAVSNFFSNLWEKITGLFGGGPNVAEEAGKAAEAANSGTGDKKGGLFGGIFGDIFSGFINDKGQFDLIHGVSTGIVKLFELIGSIDWTSIAGNIFGVMVDVVNGLDDACGKLHIDNILRVITKILGAFTGMMILKSIGDITSTIKTIVKKGKDKSIFEQFTDLLSALGTALLQIGIAILLIAGSMWLISKIDEKRFGTALGVMIGIGIFLVGFVLIAYVLTRTMGKDANKLAKTFAAIGSMFLQIAIAVAIVVAAVWLVSLMLGENGEISDKLRNAMIIVGGIMLVMAGIVIMIGQLTKNVGAVNISIGIATFVGIAILLAVCVAAILLLQNVDPGKAFTVIGEITVLLGLITGMIILLSKTVKKFNPKMLVGMIAMAVMLGLVVAALVILKDADGVNLIAIAGAIAIVLGVMVGAVIAMQAIGPGALKGAAIFAAALVIIVGALALCALMVAGAATSVTNALVTVMSNMAAASVSAELVNADAIKNVLGLLGDVAVALAQVGSVDSGPAVAIAKAAWDVANEFSLASTSAELVNINQFNKLFGEDGKGGLLQVIQTALSSITETGATAVTLGANLETFGNSLQLFGQSGVNLSKVIDESGTTYMQGIENIKNRMADIVEIVQLATSASLTSWMAGSLGTNVETLGNSLQQVGQAGSTLGEGGTYAVGIANVKDRLTDIQAIVQLATSLGTVGEGDSLKQIDLTSFAEGIANIGSALQLYNQALASFEKENAGVESTDTAPVNTDSIRQALEAIIAAIPSAMPDEGQISGIEAWADMAGSDEGKTSRFALGLTSLANSMSVFSSAAKDFDDANSSKAISALGLLAEIFTKVNDPSSYTTPMSQVAAWTPGSTYTQGTFANSIIGMANALGVFSTCAKDYDETNSSKAIAALQLLATIFNEVQSPGDYTSDISSVAGWDPGSTYAKGTFANAIVGMGTAMAAFGNAVKDIPSTAVNDATTALQTLVAIYKELNGNEDMFTYFTAEGIFGKITIGKDNKSASDTFTEFGEGIGKLGSALGTFGKAIGAETYDADKVKAATGILNDMKDMQIALQGADLNSDWWTRLWFGDNDLKKLGDNMSGLGARLSTFASELKGFDIDINGSSWKNVSGVLSFMTEIWKDLGAIVTDQGEYDAETGQITSYVSSSGYNLQNLADGINRIRESMVEFNKAMQKTYTGEGGGNTYKLGDWAETNWKNMMTVITDLKQMSIDLKNAGLKEGQFYDLDAFAFDIKELVNELNGSKLTEFMNKLDVPSDPGSITTKFAAFSECIKALVGASATLHGSNVNADDVNNMTSIISALMSMDTSNWNTETLNMDAVALAAQFVGGFASRLAQTGTTEGETGSTVSGAMDALLAVIEGYAESFLEKGKNAGEQYATGFNQGLESIDSGRLTPVIDMDETGSVTGGTGIVAVLSAMKYATSADIGTLAERLDTINAHFTNPINVNDGHAAALNTISGKLDALDKLENIKSDVGALKADVKNLKVYIDSKILVGAIAPEMNRKLGAMANVSP